MIDIAGTESNRVEEPGVLTLTFPGWSKIRYQQGSAVATIQALSPAAEKKLGIPADTTKEVPRNEVVDCFVNALVPEFHHEFLKAVAGGGSKGPASTFVPIELVEKQASLMAAMNRLTDSGISLRAKAVHGGLPAVARDTLLAQADLEDHHVAVLQLMLKGLR